MGFCYIEYMVLSKKVEADSGFPITKEKKREKRKDTMVRAKLMELEEYSNKTFQMIS